jgi:hypothetical protein
MGRLSTLLTFKLLMLATAGASQPAGNGQERTVPLTSVGLVADIDEVDSDDPGTGGGFETAAYFRTRLTSARAIQACMDPVERAAIKWANGLGLSRTLRDQSQSTMTLHYTKPGLSGFFAVVYKVQQQVKARIRVDFIVLDGSQKSPELAQDLLQSYQIGSFQDALDSAVRCEGKGS